MSWCELPLSVALPQLHYRTATWYRFINLAALLPIANYIRQLRGLRKWSVVKLVKLVRQTLSDSLITIQLKFVKLHQRLAYEILPQFYDY